jgi:2,3-bisphosphoglycerate-dependent phosphoglycerate mutase
LLTNIYFVRHAHSMFTSDELNRPLSEKGLKDVTRITELLSQENITNVLSSPYKRAIQTVYGVAQFYKHDIIIDDGFRERKLADNAVDNFNEAIIQAWENLNFALPGGETGYNAQERGVESLKNTINKYRGGNIVIGTHGNIMVLIMNYYNKKFNFEFWKNLNMPDIYKLSFNDEILLEVEKLW